MVRGAWRAWNGFWFRPSDPTTLGLIRICCGLIALYTHAAYTTDLGSFFGPHAWYDLRIADQFRHETPWVPPSWDWSDPVVGASDPGHADYVKRWGIDPGLTIAQGQYCWSMWFHVTGPTQMLFLHGFALAAMFCLTIGLCTRLASALSWVLAMSYVQRSPVTLFGMDTMVCVSLLYLMIGPSGAAFSVDRLLAAWRARRRGEYFPVQPPACVSANFALRLFQVHFCFIYMAAGLSKLMGSSWWSGTAVWGTMANYEFAPLEYSMYRETLRWLCRHRLLWELVTTGSTVYTLALEISFPFLVWNSRFRGIMVSGSVVLHTAIGMVMGLLGFGLIMLPLVFSFVPPEAARSLWRSTVPIRNARPMPLAA